MNKTDRFKNKLFITLDVDWVSDEVIYYCLELLLKNKAKATWFITHDSPAIKELFKYPDLFEVGIHPNFLPNSTQGSNIEEVMDSLLSIYPQATVMRTHSLYQSSLMFSTIVEKYSQIKLDVSLFTPYVKYVEFHKLSFGNKYIKRIPYIWEDDFAITPPHHKDLYFDARLKRISGPKIFDFHPIHVALNSCSLDKYADLKRHHDISKIGLKELFKFRNQANSGIQTFLNELLTFKDKTAIFKELSLY